MKLSRKFLLSATALGLVAAPLSSLTTADASSLPGPIYKLSSNPTVYIDRNGSLHAIASKAMFYALGYQFNALHVVNHLPAPVGSPVSLLRLPSQSKVYQYSGGQLHWIPSAKIFVARGYQWNNIYTVSKLPGPIGSPLTMPVTPPSAILPLSGFPDVIAGQTKTVTVDALNSSSHVDQSYSGRITVRIAGSAHGFSLSTGSSSTPSSSVTISLHNGVGTVQLHSPTTSWQSVTILAGSQSNTHTQKFVSVPNTSSQVGWRVFDAAGNPVTGQHPATGSSSQTFTLQPVNAKGDIVSGTMTDNVNITADPQLTQCPEGASLCNVIRSPYMTTTGQSFAYTPNSYSPTPIVFTTTAERPYQAKVTAVTSGTSHSPLPVSPRMNTGSVIQTVAGISANTKYQIQMQLQTQSGKPITDLPVLNDMHDINLNIQYATKSGAPEIIQRGRTTPSAIGFTKLGTNHVYYTYQSGSATSRPNQTPDIISLFGTSPAAASGLPGTITVYPFLQLITNAF